MLESTEADSNGRRLLADWLRRSDVKGITFATMKNFWLCVSARGNPLHKLVGNLGCQLEDSLRNVAEALGCGKSGERAGQKAFFPITLVAYSCGATTPLAG